MKRLAMWVSDQRTEFVLTEDAPFAGECKKAHGGMYYGLHKPEDVHDYVQTSAIVAPKTCILRFIVDNAWGVPAKKRARYMQIMTFCLLNAFGVRDAGVEQEA